MRIFICLATLFVSLNITAQSSSVSGVLSIDAIKTTPTIKSLSLVVDQPDPTYTVRFTRLPNIDGVKTFSVFNKTTGLNDVFIVTGGNQIYSTSSLLVDNVRPRQFQRVDSFNPNATGDIGSAILNGVLELIFN